MDSMKDILLRIYAIQICICLTGFDDMSSSGKSKCMEHNFEVIRLYMAQNFDYLEFGINFLYLRYILYARPE